MLLLTNLILPAFAEEVKFILHDSCINNLYKPAALYFENSEIYVIRDSRGIILRFGLVEPETEYRCLTDKTLEKIQKVGVFLAKIKNPVIIEVHVADFKNNSIKNWEVSAIIAGRLVQMICLIDKQLKDRISSVGFGEFLPAKNTSNNGGNFSNRVDIIILCNISGE